MTNYKQLCADLVAWAEKASAHYYSEPGVLIRARTALAEPEPPSLKELVERARTALAEPEPEDPTGQELKTFACEWWSKFGFVKDKATCSWVLDEIDPDHFANFARDVLARWGK